MRDFQLDFKDASSVPADPHGKKQHLVETLNIIDKGTSVLVRFCHTLGVVVLICDPHYPQQNGEVSRYHRTLTQECLRRERPKTLDEVRQATEAFATHYNWRRPLKADQLWQSASPGRLSQPALSAFCSRSSQSRCLVKSGERTASGAAGQSPGRSFGRFVPLLHLQQARWPESHLIHPGQGVELAGGLSTGVSSLCATQRLASTSAALSGVSSTHAA